MPPPDRFTVLSLTPPDLIDSVRARRGEPDVAYDLLNPTTDELSSVAARADVIVGDWTHQRSVDADLLARAVRCRTVVQPNAGYDRVDVDAAQRLGIAVANVPGANADSVAEWVVMSVLVVLKHVVEMDAATRHGHWMMAEGPRLGVGELAGRRAGIVGFGAIGQGVARRLRAFDIGRLRYYDIREAPADVEASLDAQRSDLDELLASSDVVTVHVPLLAATRDLLDARRLALLRRDAVLVNASRGGVVDEAALRARLVAGELRGAAVDVFASEPLPAGSPWADTPRTLLSPHLAGSTAEACWRMLDAGLDAVERALRGDLPPHVVNGVTELRLPDR